MHGRPRRSRSSLDDAGVKGSQVQILSSRQREGLRRSQACGNPLLCSRAFVEVEHAAAGLLDSTVSTMPLLDLTKLTAGLSRTWVGFLRDWDRSLRSANHPETTRYNYLLAAAQLGRYLAEYSPDPDADDAAEDPTAVTRAHVEAFQAWMIETRSASTALNKHKGLQQFFRWLAEDEQEITRSPMERVRQPKTPTKLIPVIRDEDTKRLLEACKGKGFVQLRERMEHRPQTVRVDQDRRRDPRHPRRLLPTNYCNDSGH